MIPSATALPLFALLTLTLGLPLFSNIPTTEEDTAYRKTKKNTLRLVTVVIRHGERAPVDTYPSDPHVNDTMEPYGWGQLTNKGRRNQYNQGLFLRKRYDNFLGSTYEPDIFYLQTTAVDRTKMSGMVEAAALWRPNEEQSFIPNLPWQPVTLFYQEREDDTLMLVWNTCPRYTQLRSSANDLPEVRKLHEDNKQLFANLTHLTGMPITTVDDVSSLYATLSAEDEMGLVLPEWTKDYYPEKLTPLALYELQLNTYNDECRRLKGGPMLKKFIDEMRARKAGIQQPKRRKMFMYIGHDSTIVTLLDTMHIWSNQLPYYNIMTMIELHEDEGDWNVQVFLRNTTTHEPYMMTIPGCTVVCPLDKFVEILEPMIPNDWEQECKVDSNYTTPPPPPP
ncbi:PREDICTED: prostatic acid phosphatase-like [Vollenhovia emeryi]|uniref:prostatic acid phosphatase-like n=1 Tax=Vollenhovia emeryi TaxID=411798 RepID=UPI0005F4D3DE|nr:PREDICTED: prostatic acid phosphatase-like [Vollenhovia emeryi]